MGIHELLEFVPKGADKIGKGSTSNKEEDPASSMASKYKTSWQKTNALW